MFVGLLLLAGALWFDGAVVRDIVRQRRATHYAVTEGVITSSRANSEYAGEGGPVYSLAVTYDYSVGGHAFSGDHYYVNDWGGTSDPWAEETARALPPGRRVSVYYPPEDPARAILAPGVTGGQLLLALMGFPLTLIPASVIIGARRRMAGGPGLIHDETAQKPRAEHLAKWLVLSIFARLTPLGGAAMGACAAAFSELLLILIIFGGHPPIVVPIVAWIAALTAALGGYRASRRCAPPRAASR